MLHHGVCRHFTGIGAGHCAQQIPYRQFHGLAYPCLPRAPRDPRPQATCPQHDVPTEEEVRADQARVEAEMRAYFAEYAAREDRHACGQCETPLTAKVQVGRCIYNVPCGCRVGQGTLTKDGKRVTRLEIATS